MSPNVWWSTCGLLLAPRNKYCELTGIWLFTTLRIICVILFNVSIKELSKIQEYIGVALISEGTISLTVLSDKQQNEDLLKTYLTCPFKFTNVLSVTFFFISGILFSITLTFQNSTVFPLLIVISLFFYDNVYIMMLEIFVNLFLAFIALKIDPHTN